MGYITLTVYVLNLFQEHISTFKFFNHFPAFYHFPGLKWHRSLKSFPVDEKDPYIVRFIVDFMTVNDLARDDIIKWKHFTRYWPFVRGIHRSPVKSPRKGQWPGALMLLLICVWINGWENNREAGDLGSHRAHDDVIVMNTRSQGISRHGNDQVSLEHFGFGTRLSD